MIIPTNQSPSPSSDKEASIPKSKQCRALKCGERAGESGEEEEAATRRGEAKRERRAEEEDGGGGEEQAERGDEKAEPQDDVMGRNRANMAGDDA